jgi:Sec-independent protein secretion pathway component TatC
MNMTVTLNDLDKRVKLSTLWIYVFLNMIFRDLHQFGNVDFVEGMMTGVVDGVQITEGLMLIGGIMIAVPLLMVPLTQFLNLRANRLANLFIGVLQIVVIIGVNMAPDLDDIFFAVIEIVALLLIIRLAWNWKENAV